MKVDDFFTPLTEIRDVAIHRGRDVIDDNLSTRLRKAGWRWLGAGSFSTVYGKGNYVLKAFMDDESPGTRCLIRYHRMAMKSNNPHFPKVYFVKTYRGDANPRLHPPQNFVQYYLIATEKLYPMSVDLMNKLWQTMPHNPQKRAERIAFLTDQAGLLDRTDAVNELVGMGILQDYPNMATWEKMSHYRLEIEELAERYIDDHINDDPMVKAIATINQMPKHDKSCFTDMGGNNTMMRKDGTVVFSDPIADDDYYSG